MSIAITNTLKSFPIKGCFPDLLQVAFVESPSAANVKLTSLRASSGIMLFFKKIETRKHFDKRYSRGAEAPQGKNMVILGNDPTFGINLYAKHYSIVSFMLTLEFGTDSTISLFPDPTWLFPDHS